MAENYIATLGFTGQGQTAEQSCSVCVPMASGDKSGVVAHGHVLTARRRARSPRSRQTFSFQGPPASANPPLSK
jgi:hypothetical protein